jgi:hypothetical protein
MISTRWWLIKVNTDNQMWLLWVGLAVYKSRVPLTWMAANDPTTTIESLALRALHTINDYMLTQAPRASLRLQVSEHRPTLSNAEALRLVKHNHRAMVRSGLRDHGHMLSELWRNTMPQEHHVSFV